MQQRLTVLARACLLGAVLALTACGDGPAEEAGEQIDESAEEAQDTAEEAGEEVEEAAGDDGDS